MRKRIVVFTIIIALILPLSFFGCGASQSKEVLRVAIPYSDNIEDIDTNYYINWLEERTGLDIEVITVRQTRSEDYLRSLFSSDVDVDVVFFGGDFNISADTVADFVASGDIYEDEDGRSYYISSGSGINKNVGQIMWINVEWLSKLGLSIPNTTEELEKVLTAFRDNDPNGNGIKDEIPLVGCSDDYMYSPLDFILNAYIYNDPYHSRYGLNDNKDELNAVTDEFREGLIFCHHLYEEGLLDEGAAAMNHSHLSELVNSPADLVGAFTTASISDVIYQGNPEIMAKYMHVAPLAGPKGFRSALYVDREPSVGAVITSRSNKKEEAKLLLDTMLSEEASLIARFGEQGVDWDYSDGSDVSIYGSVSTIVTKNYIWNTPQNKHLNGIGPMDVPQKYIEGVTWNGVNSDSEYIDARAQMSYIDYLPEVDSFHEKNDELSEYIDQWLADFVTGNKDIESESEWENYIKGSSRYLW